MKMRRGLLTRAAAVAAGIAAAFLLLEVALRITGLLFAPEKGGVPFAARDNSFVILCLGDSFTYGAEAPRGRDYPARLQELFDRENAGRRVIVVNRGILGANSRAVLECLPELLNRIRPDVVTMLVGASNGWNLYGAERFFGGRGAADGISGVWGRLRTVRLWRLVTGILGRDPLSPLAVRRQELENPPAPPEDSGYYRFNVWLRSYFSTFSGAPSARNAAVSEAFLRGESLAAEGKFAGALEIWENAVESDPRDTRSLVAFCQTALRCGLPGTGPALARRAVEKAPDFSELYFLLAHFEQQGGFWEEAARTCLEAVGRFPEHRKHYDKFVKILECAPDPALRVRWAAQFKARAGRGALAREYAPRLDWLVRASAGERAGVIRRWLLSDLEEIIRECRRRGVGVVLQNYPLPFAAVPDLKEFSAARGVRFVDHEARFAALPDRQDFLAQNHCNEKGYALMAQGLYEALREDIR